VTSLISFGDLFSLQNKFSFPQTFSDNHYPASGDSKISMQNKTKNIYAHLAAVIAVLFFASVVLKAQSLFPIKKDKKWGLMNSDGQLVQQPVYDAIGEFKQFGYAVMQRSGKVGMLSNKGSEVGIP